MTGITEPIANEGRVKPQSSLKRLGKRLLQSKTGMVGLIIVVGVILMAILAPLLTDNDPAKTDVINRLIPPFWLEGGNTEFLLGTDNLGRDILSRIIY